MQRSIFSLLLAFVATSALAQSIASVGSYRLVPDAETKAHCKKHKLPLPKGELTLMEDSTFALTVNDHTGLRRTFGSYVRDGEFVRFSVEEGLGQDLPHVMRISTRGLNGKGSAYSRVIEAPAKLPVETAIKVPTPTPLSTCPLDGVFVGTRDGVESDQKVTLTLGGGKFRFTGLGFRSAGEFFFDPGAGCFTLVYTDIDGVRPSRRIEKTVAVDLDGTFTIERCVYRRK